MSLSSSTTCANPDREGSEGGNGPAIVIEERRGSCGGERLVLTCVAGMIGTGGMKIVSSCSLNFFEST